MLLNLEPLPWAHSIIEDFDHEEFGVSAGLGAGKTHGAVEIHLATCLINNESPFSAFTEPLFRLLHSVAIPTFQKVFQEIGWTENRDYRVIKSSVPKIELKRTNQTIWLFSSHDPDSIVGDEYSHFTNDEAGESKDKTFENLQARTRSPQAKTLRGVNVGAPQGITRFAQLFGTEEEGGPAGWIETAPGDYSNPKLKRRRLRLRTFDNPFVAGGGDKVQEYCEKLYRQYGHNPNLIESYIYGKFVPHYEGSAYKFIPSRNVIHEGIEPSPYRPLYVSFDFNAYPMAWVACQIVPFEGELCYVFIDECSEDLHGLDEALLDFCKKFPRSEWKQSDIKVYGDRSGHAKTHRSRLSDYDYIRKELGSLYDNVSIQASRKVAPEVDSIEACNRLFSVGRLLCLAHLSGLQRSWQGSRWKDGVRKLHKPSGETITHKADAGKYLIYQLEVLDALSKESRVYGINA